jgi:hypothetical protein
MLKKRPLSIFAHFEKNVTKVETFVTLKINKLRHFLILKFIKRIAEHHSTTNKCLFFLPFSIIMYLSCNNKSVVSTNVWSLILSLLMDTALF